MRSSGGTRPNDAQGLKRLIQYFDGTLIRACMIGFNVCVDLYGRDRDLYHAESALVPHNHVSFASGMSEVNKFWHPELAAPMRRCWMPTFALIEHRLMEL